MTADFDFFAFPTLSAQRTVLRELDLADADVLFAFRSDPDVQRYNSAPMRDPAEAAALIEQLRAEYAGHQPVHWAITLPGDSRVLGLIGLVAWRSTTHGQRSAMTSDATTGAVD